MSKCLAHNQRTLIYSTSISSGLGYQFAPPEFWIGLIATNGHGEMQFRFKFVCAALATVSFALTFITNASGKLPEKSDAPKRSRPNILFIAADDLRNDLGCYGHETVISPNIDRLAKNGILFEHAYCQQAVCNPSRASLMTGKRLDRLRIWDLPTHFRDTKPNAVTLPQQFKNNGYFTQNIGKIFHNWIHKRQGDRDSWSVPAVLHFATHGSDEPVVKGHLPVDHARYPKCERRNVPDDAYFDGRITDLAVTALKDLSESDRPFFLAVGYWKPHAPFNAPKKYWDLYNRDEIAMPANPKWPTNAPRIAWHNSREILGRKPRRLNMHAAREIRHGYLAAISYLDAQIGRLLETLKETGGDQNTIIVFWSDHGYHLGEQTLWAKTSNFELDARVPLIITTPNMKTAGKRTDSVVELLDIYPTLLELADLEIPADIDGSSLVPILKNPETSVRDVALSQHPRPAYYKGSPDVMGYSVRSQTHRYTEWRNWKTGETIATELYDHRKDPLETRNIFGRKNTAHIIDSHAKSLDALNPIVRPGWKPVLP